MKIAEVRLPDEWEQWSCEICPFSYLHDTEDGLENVCILQTESDGCPVKAKEEEEWER